MWRNLLQFLSGYCYVRSWLELAALFLTSEEIIVSNYAVFICSIEKKTFLASKFGLHCLYVVSELLY